MKVVQICKDGSMDDIDCKFTTKNICKVLTETSKSQGTNNIKLLYSWNYDKCTLLCYGWYDGEAGFENKHDIAPGGSSSFLETDSSEKLLFGDLFIIKKDKKYLPFEVSDYGEFYNFAFEGFDDCDTDNESINTEEEDEDYIQKVEESDEEDVVDSGEDDILEEDITEY
jgi:hypothetical protein